MTQIDQPLAAAAPPGVAGGAAVPAWRIRHIGGVDAVAGDPAVPLSVWYPAGPHPAVAAGGCGDGWPAELARQTVAGLAGPGDLVVDIDGDEAVRAAAAAERCRYLSVRGTALRRRSGTAAAARLIALRWPRPVAGPADPLAAAASAAVVDLLVACRQLLADDGHVAAALTPPAGDGPFVDPAGPLLAAAPAAGLGYLQHIVRLDRPLVGDRLAADVPRQTAATTAAVAGRHRRVHRDVVVLVLRVGRHV